MTAKLSTPTTRIVSGILAVADSYQWSNPYGGAWGTAGNWTDLTTGTVAASAPGLSNAVTIVGGSAIGGSSGGGSSGGFINITGTGAAAQLAIGNDVLLWGTVAIGGTATIMGSADLDLDGGATLAAGALALGNAAALEVSGGSYLAAAGGATLAGGLLEALNGGSVQLGGLVANGVNNGYASCTGLIAVDGGSSIEVGTAGGAALGAITIDAGVTAAVTGTVEGNLIVNGSVAVQAGGRLTIDVTDPLGAATAISGSGTVAISENSLLTLGIADSAAIAFNGPNGTLVLDALPSGTISGFTSGDVIELAVSGGTSVATGLSLVQTGAQTAMLTLLKGGVAAGTLALAGNYTSGVFHLTMDAKGDGFISEQTIGSAPVQPGRIIGTAGYDVLTATAPNQVLTGLGGNDLLSAAGLRGVAFLDTSGNLNGGTVTAFAGSDLIDLTDVAPATASFAYTPSVSGIGTLAVSDGTHSATMGFAFSNGLQPGFFSAGADGSGGTDVTYTVANTDLFSFMASPGGSYATAALWQDITTGTVASVAPSYGNAVAINGVAGAYAVVSGSGFAASLTTGACVLLLGTLNAGSKLSGVSGNLAQAGKLALDYGAKFSCSLARSARRGSSRSGAPAVWPRRAGLCSAMVRRWRRSTGLPSGSRRCPAAAGQQTRR